MNILFLSEFFYPHGGGAEFATYLYAKLLSKSGFNVVVVTNRFAGEKESSKRGNLTIHRLPLFKSGSGVKYPILTRIDVLFSNYMRKLLKWASLVYIPKSWYSMIPLAKVYRKPVIVHVHDYSPICPLAILYSSSNRTVCQNRKACSARCIYQFEMDKKSSFKDSALSLSLNLFARLPIQKFVEQAEAIVCVSKAQQKILTESMPLISHKTHVVYNPMPNISPVEVDGDDFGYLGGFSLLKGFNVLCKSLSLVNTHSFKVHVTGTSITREIGSERARLEFFNRLGIVLHERMKHSGQENFYRQIKGVIFPSIVPEPLPYVTAEAILRGRLLIASRTGGIPEQVKGCKGAFLFEAGNYNELAEILGYAKNLDRNTVLELGYHDRDVFRRTFNNEKTLADFEKIISSLT
ncbi:MAG: glycosyltransferase family 4 protein [Candidatus Bathyarchaeia archaeon]